MVLWQFKEKARDLGYRNLAFTSYATAKPGNNRTALSFSPDM